LMVPGMSVIEQPLDTLTPNTPSFSRCGLDNNGFKLCGSMMAMKSPSPFPQGRHETTCSQIRQRPSIYFGQGLPYKVASTIELRGKDVTNLPANMPEDSDAAFAYIGTVTAPTVDDFKLMIYLEASGQGFYQALADVAPTPEISDLLARTGREEMAHAHRLQKVIEQISGESFAVPTPEENPYFAVPEGIELTEELLGTIAEGEFGGELLYEGWAQSLDNEDAAKLLRQNGKEERIHGERAQQVVGLLTA